MGKGSISSEARKFGLRDKVGYALGDAGGTLAFGVVTSFLQMYYTDVLHISLAKITVFMLVTRIWDAINDPIWGAFIDSRRPTKHGRFRPYILGASFPYAIVFILMFIKIPGLNENQYLIIAYITYILYDMMYTGTNIPYGSLASVITSDGIERSQLSVFRSLGAGIGSLPGQIILPLFVYSTTATGARYLDGNKLLGGVIILAGISIVIYYLHFRLTTERVQALPVKEKLNIIKTIKTLLRNRPFIILCFSSMFLIAASMYTQTIYNYLFKNYYEKPELFSLVMICTYIPMLTLMPFMTKLVKRFGKKELCAAGMLFAAFVNLIMWIARIQNPYIFLVLTLFSGFGLCCFTLEVWALVTDVIDYQEYLSHRREEGTCFAFFSFSRKLGQTIAGTGASIALSIIGYNVSADVVKQSEAVISNMYDIATLVPVGMYLIMFLLLGVFYPLNKNKLEKLHNELSM